VWRSAAWGGVGDCVGGARHAGRGGWTCASVAAPRAVGRWEWIGQLRRCEVAREHFTTAMAGGGTNGGGQAAGNPPAAASSAASAVAGGPPAMNAPGMPMPAGMMAPEGMFGIPPAGQAPMPAGQYRPPTATTSHAQQSHAQQGAQVLDAQLTTFWTEQQTEVRGSISSVGIWWSAFPRWAVLPCCGVV